MSIYGLIIGAAIILGIELLRKKTLLFSNLDYLFISFLALLGARIVFLLHNIEEIQNQTVRIFHIWDGGLAFYGALLGILLALWILSLRKKVKLFELSDTLFVFLPLIQAIGRIGNYFNNELYGKPSKLPWAIEIPLEKRLQGYEQYTTFHPVFLYESLSLLLLFFFLLKTPVKKKGLLTGLYFVGYATIRLLMNTIRIDKEYIIGIETSNFFSCIFFVIGSLLILSISSMKYRKAIANFFSKIVMIGLIVFAAITFGIHTQLSLLPLLVLITFTFLAPISAIILFNILGITSDINITKREERPRLFLTIFASLLISLITSIYLGNSTLIIIYSIVNLTFILGFFITLFWKISYHMIWSTLSIFTAIYLLNNDYYYLLFALLPFIAWSRVELKRHTYPQVILGTLLPLFCIFLVLTFLKF